jgi:hypothetical protein
MRLLAALAILPFLMACLTVAQEVKAPHVSNVIKIARLWNSIGPATELYNEHMNAADKLIHERFNPKIVVVDPDAKRRETVGHLKAAREALLSELDAVNELIEEEDY